MSGTLPAFWRACRDAMVPALSFRAAALPHAEWRSSAAARYAEALALPLPLAPATVREAGRDEVGAFSVLRLEADFANGGRTEGALLAAKDTKPRRAVLLLHDHGGCFDIGWRKGFPLPEARAWQDRLYGGASPAAELARRGFAVVSFDALGWGARSVGAHSDQQALASNLLQVGLSAAGVVAAEDAAMAGWAAAQPWAAGGMAAFGFSFGAFRAWQVAALSPHVLAAAAISWMGRRADLLVEGSPMTRGQSAFWTVHPSLTTQLDFPDMAGLAAPKPLYLRTGDADRHFPAATVRAAHADLAAIYTAAGAYSALDAGVFEGGHVCPPGTLAAAADFLSGAASTRTGRSSSA